MKTRFLAILTVLLLTLSLCVPVLASDGIMNYVIDADDLLTYEEWEPLEDQAADISGRHGCGVYVLFLYDYTAYGSGSVYDTASQLYHDENYGEGEGRNGIMLLVSMSTRDYALFVYGEKAEYTFNSYGLAELEDAFLPSLSENDWCGGFFGYLAACDKYLTQADAGKPVQESVAQRILPVVGISCGISLVICLVLKSKMKTVRRKRDAMGYVAFGGLNLTERYDRFTHTTETRRHIEKDTSKNESGGGGSGRSGKF